MESLRYVPRWRPRAAGAVVAAICSASTLAAVLLTFASASGELDPAVARLKAAPAASAVAAKVPGKRPRG